MLRSAALTGLVAAVLAGAAPAAADPFGELPFRPVRGVATCLRATGAPGELARWVPGGVELLHATRAGLAPAGVVILGGHAVGCPVVAGAPGGAAIAAEVERHARREFLRVAVRDPGGAFGPAVTVARVSAALDLAVAVAPGGDAVVAVPELRGGRTVRIVAFRRRAGRAFGAREVLDTTPFRRVHGVPSVVAAMDAGGAATLAWQTDVARVAAAAPGARFGAPQRLGRSDTAPALAEAPDGRALAVLTRDGRTVAAERAPGHAVFGRPAVLGENEALGPELSVAAALRTDGAAVVGWSDVTGAVSAVARPGPGAFGPPVILARGRQTGGFTQTVRVSTPLRSPFDEDGGVLRAAAGAGGFALAWIAHGTARAALLDAGGGAASAPGGTAHAAGGAAAATPGGTARAAGDAAAATPGGTATALGGPLRPAASTAALALAGGTPAVAWADDDGEPLVPTGAGRVHVAVAGAADAVDPPPPAVSVPRLPRQRRYLDQPLHVDVICAAACDVKVTHAGAGSRPRAGRLRFGIFAGPVRPGRRSVGVTVRVAGPGGHRVRTVHVRVPETVLAPPPVPQPLAVRARRHGNSLTVSWRVAFAGRHVTYVVLGYRSRRARNPLTLTTVHGRLHARLPGAGRVRYVTVVAISAAGGPERKASVRVSA